MVAVVESGSVTRQLENDCRVVTFTQGEVFTEVVGHLVANPSTTDDAVLRITQFIPANIDPSLYCEDVATDPCL